MQAKALTDSGAVISGQAEFMGISAYNGDSGASRITIYDSAAASGKVIFDGYVAATTGIVHMINNSKGRGVKCYTGLYLSVSNNTDIQVVSYFT